MKHFCFADKLQNTATNRKAQCDAAFADYLINIGCTIHL